MEKLCLNIFHKLKSFSHKFEDSQCFNIFCALSLYILSRNIFKILKHINSFTTIRKYGSDWIIITDGCKIETITICINFLKLSQEFKFILIGQDENKLLKNIESIHKHGKNTIIEYLIYEYYQVNYEDFQQKFENIFVNRCVTHISIIIFNADYIARNYFDKLDLEQIQKMLNVNLNDRMLKNILSSLKVRHENLKTLLILKGNLLSTLKLPTFQVYYSLKSVTKQFYNCQAQYDLCYIQDADNFDKCFCRLNFLKKSICKENCVNWKNNFHFKFSKMSKYYKSYFKFYILLKYNYVQLY